MNNELIEKTLDDLIDILNKDKKLFKKTYPLIPFEIYKQIERLAISKSVVNKELCAKAKLVSTTFHKHFK